ncbi:LysR family transcriptional regulator [Klebsiella aerogenes]|uniref:LysR family transcriptional regulator n=1 Tax=Klebsiella aerogenes TaxID=548 RepID=UPI002DBB463A|nr:LysR family transcriptional regulator [Klebsiella aerogenes]MEB5742660.1 LysR family transcriptional regulator [Klebsiella aerogenes]
MRDFPDIKILKVVHFLVMNNSVTKTAELLNVSPGTISYMLNKARQLTGSSLFLRTQNGMIPNQVATELSNHYINITKELKNYSEIKSSANRVFTISTYSLLEFMLAETLSDKEKFPIMLKFNTPEDDNDSRLRRLRNKEVDIDIGTRLESDRSIVQTRLFSSDLSIFMSKNNPRANAAFTLEDWLEAEHVRWSRRTDFICDDYNHANRFHQIMEKKNVSMVSSDSLNMAVLCAFTNHVMLMPLIVSRFLTNHFPTKILPAPPELNMRFECYLHYHNSLIKDEVLNVILSHFRMAIEQL